MFGSGFGIASLLVLSRTGKIIHSRDSFRGRSWSDPWTLDVELTIKGHKGVGRNEMIELSTANSGK